MLDRGRAGATLGLPIAVADLLIFNIAVAAGLITTGSRHRVLLCLMAFFFVIGVFAAGEFSNGMWGFFQPNKGKAPAV